MEADEERPGKGDRHDAFLSQATTSFRSFSDFYQQQQPSPAPWEDPSCPSTAPISPFLTQNQSRIEKESDPCSPGTLASSPSCPSALPPPDPLPPSASYKKSASISHLNSQSTLPDFVVSYSSPFSVPDDETLSYSSPFSVPDSQSLALSYSSPFSKPEENQIISIDKESETSKPVPPKKKLSRRASRKFRNSTLTIERNREKKPKTRPTMKAEMDEFYTAPHSSSSSLPARAPESPTQSPLNQPSFTLSYQASSPFELRSSSPQEEPRSKIDLIQDQRDTTRKQIFEQFSKKFCDKVNEVEGKDFFPTSAVQNIGEIFSKFIAPLLSSSSKDKSRFYLNITPYFFGLSCLGSTFYFEEYNCGEFETTKLLNDFFGDKAKCVIPTDTWKPSIIPRAFVKLGQYLKRPLSSTEIEKFRSALLGYTRFLAKNPEDWHPIFEQIAFDHLDYLKTHSVDPFNHMIGAIPSSFFVEKYLSEPLESFELEALDFTYLLQRWANFESSERVSKEVKQLFEKEKEKRCLVVGEFVFLELKNLPSDFKAWYFNENWREDCWEYICFRVAKVGNDFVEVVVNPEESLSLRVKRNAVRKLNGSCEELFSNEKDLLFFSNPLEPWEKEIENLINSEVENILTSNELGFNQKIEDFTLEDLTGLHLEKKRSMALADSTLSGLCTTIDHQILQNIDKWIECLPSGLFANPRLTKALDEIEIFLLRVPIQIQSKFQMYLNEKVDLIKQLILVFKSLLDGSKKIEVCGKWLQIVEKGVDEFLEEKGYSHNVIPYNYLNCTLTTEEIEMIKKNHSILKQILAEPSGGELDSHIQVVTKTVYDIIDPFMQEIELGLVVSRQPEILEVDPDLLSKVPNLERDLLYLKKMKEMDDEIQQLMEGDAKSQKFEMTEAVPVAGLFMARIHIYESECLSVLEIQKKKEKKEVVEEEEEGYYDPFS